MNHRPLVLVILDGWGHREARARTFHGLLERYPHTLLSASGEEVGLPPGLMGNSEVGHMNLGAGRVVRQDITRIDQSIHAGGF
ncbi:MAG: 2,3-bisphosphoglycerate-independent phosphoglycerate mutase, partial [Planctomycetota bacterium]|nr:2,3-bisphosphoglycerate-independent phosphoglycerate mutase [Planctomycetota bacterium]